MITNLPENIKDCIGCKLVLKPNADKNSINVFGTEPYIFDVSKDPVLLAHCPLEDIIRLFPEEEYPSGRVHAIGCSMTYDQLRGIFVIATAKPINYEL